MRLAMVGVGYVGLVSGACFADFGHDVICVDVDQDRIDRLMAGEMPIFEPGLEALVQRNVAAKRLSFTISLEQAIARAEVIFLAVGTPSRRFDGHADLEYVYAAAREIAVLVRHPTVVVTKSTVPVDNINGVPYPPRIPSTAISMELNRTEIPPARTVIAPIKANAGTTSSK